jgi:hypothetical protein
MRNAIPAALVALAVLASAVGVAAQKPVRELPIFINGPLPPASPAEMIRAADAVIVARYTGTNRLVARGTRGASKAVDSTDYAFEILEVLKFDPLLPPGVEPQIDIRLEGGDRELPTRIERTAIAHTEPLIPHHRYAVFLSRNTVRDELYLAWAGASLYDITSDTVRSLDRERRRQEGMPVAEFLDALRAAQ